ncbi:unnamed protein product [Acidocella sp. C78]|nr:unnamed protein product [Acidocella sp. C78]
MPVDRGAEIARAAAEGLVEIGAGAEPLPSPVSSTARTESSASMAAKAAASASCTASFSAFRRSGRLSFSTRTAPTLSTISSAAISVPPCVPGD